MINMSWFKSLLLLTSLYTKILFSGLPWKFRESFWFGIAKDLLKVGSPETQKNPMISLQSSKEVPNYITMLLLSLSYLMFNDCSNLTQRQSCKHNRYKLPMTTKYLCMASTTFLINKIHTGSGRKTSTYLPMYHGHLLKVFMQFL